MKAGSSVRRAVLQYLETRRKLGFILRQEGWALQSLVRYAQKIGHTGPLTSALAVQWSQAPQAAKPLYWAKRLAIVRRLALFWRAYDPATEVPPAGLFGSANQRRPVHIYTAHQVQALLRATSALGSTKALRVKTFRTLFGLLASTGLRISEALQLDRTDIDWSQSLLSVRRSKFEHGHKNPLSLREFTSHESCVCITHLIQHIDYFRGNILITFGVTWRPAGADKSALSLNSMAGGLR